MKTIGISAGRRYVSALALLAITGLMSGPRGPLTAQEAAADSRQKAIKAVRMAREEYLTGVFLEDEKLARSQLFLAEQSQKTAKQGLEQAKKLAAKGIITPLQVESAALAIEKADKLLEVSQANLKSLGESKAQILEQFDRLERALQESRGK
jgi:HlyD family secretion protein